MAIGDKKEINNYYYCLLHICCSSMQSALYCLFYLLKEPSAKKLRLDGNLAERHWRTPMTTWFSCPGNVTKINSYELVFLHERIPLNVSKSLRFVGKSRGLLEHCYHIAEYCTKENEVLSYYFVFFIVCRLQILTCLFSKHISSLPASEFCHFFLVLHQIQTKQKRL